MAEEYYADVFDSCSEESEESEEGKTVFSVKDEEVEDEVDQPTVTVLTKVSDAAGHLKSTVIKEGNVTKADLDSGDVFIVDTGTNCFVWIGSASSPQEKQNGLGYAHMHLMKTSHPLVPIYVVKEGQFSKAFQTALAA